MMQSMLGLHCSRASSPSSQCGSGITPSYQTRLPGQNVTSFMAPNFKSHAKLVQITANASQDENNPVAGGDRIAHLQVRYHFRPFFSAIQANEVLLRIEELRRSILSIEEIPEIGQIISF